MVSVFIIPLSPFQDELLPALAHSLRTSLNTTVVVQRDISLDSVVAFDFSRHQYNSSALIGNAFDHCTRLDGKILCVTSLDLFVPVLTYVFGEAQLNGKVAVVSTFRLDETLYGFPANASLLQHRLYKEALHELGHAFGLVHCRNYQCVMHSSTSVEEIDVKGEAFCDECKEIAPFPDNTKKAKRN